MSEQQIDVTDRDIMMVAISFVMLLAAVGLLIFNVVTLQAQAHDAVETHAAACEFRQNLITQMKSSEKYLAEHPDGAPSIGLSAAQIQQGIDKQQAAVNSLSGLNCNN